MLAKDLFDVSRETVLITGGATGIGRALASVFAENGASVFIAGMEADTIDQAVAALDQAPGRVDGLVTDVTDDAAISRAFDGAEKALGPVSVVVNNAGIAHRDKSHRLPRETVREVLSVNVESAFAVAQEGARRMIDSGRGGAIINVGSILASVPFRQTAAYGASKAALTQLTRSLALEWAKYAIRVNELSPGWIETGVMQERLAGPATPILAKSTPLQRLGAPSDLAGAALLLASAAGNYMTGTTITIDGGYSLGR